jgi:hypothetical protein
VPKFLCLFLVAYLLVRPRTPHSGISMVFRSTLSLFSMFLYDPHGTSFLALALVFCPPPPLIVFFSISSHIYIAFIFMLTVFFY